jgi:hypothetical protein
LHTVVAMSEVCIAVMQRTKGRILRNLETADSCSFGLREFFEIMDKPLT